MKKKFLWMFMVAAAAMTSCSSYDEPAVMDGEGEALSRAGISRAVRQVSTQEELKDALLDEIDNILVVDNLEISEQIVFDYPVTIGGLNGGKITSTASLVCKSDVTFSGITIDATTPRGTGAINVSAEGITVVLDNVQVTQNTAGSTDGRASEGIGIMYEAYKNSLHLINGTIINLPGNYVRGICMLPQTQEEVEFVMTDSEIHCGTNLSYPSTYARGISFSNIKNAVNKPITITNSKLIGAYYNININGDCALSFDVDSVETNGRAAFNIWSPNVKATIKNSTFIGQNNYKGSSERFGTFVFNAGSENSDFTLQNINFIMKCEEGLPENIQYAISYRESNQKLKLIGQFSVNYPNRDIPAYVNLNPGVTNVEITEENFTFDHTNCVSPNFYPENL